MEEVPIAEAARRLGVSVDTVKRRLRSGQLQGHKQPGGRGGFSWLIEMNGASPGTSQGNASANATVDAPANGHGGEVQVLRALVETLQSQVQAQQKQLEAEGQQLEAKDRQIGELHVLMQRAQAALPAPKEDHPWWQFWRG